MATSNELIDRYLARTTKIRPATALRGDPDCQCPPPCPACGGLECLCRPRFFAGQVLTEDDLNRLENYVVAKGKLHNRYLHGPGVVCGLRGGLRLLRFGQRHRETGICDRPVRRRHHCVQGRQSADLRADHPLQAARQRLRPLRQPGADRMQGRHTALGAFDLLRGKAIARRAAAHERTLLVRRLVRLRRKAGRGLRLWQHHRQHLPVRRRPPGCSAGRQIDEQGGDEIQSAMRTDADLRKLSFRRQQIRRSGQIPAFGSGTLRRVGGCWPERPSSSARCCRGIIACYLRAIEIRDAFSQVKFADPTKAAEIALAYGEYLDALREFAAAHLSHRCDIARQLDQLQAPQPTFTAAGTGTVSPAEWQAAFARLNELWLEVFRECFCSALLPPCPEFETSDCVPLAVVTIDADQCRVIEICNWEAREFALTLPTLYYWTSFINWRAIRDAIAKLCCTGGPELWTLIFRALENIIKSNTNRYRPARARPQRRPRRRATATGTSSTGCRNINGRYWNLHSRWRDEQPDHQQHAHRTRRLGRAGGQTGRHGASAVRRGAADGPGTARRRELAVHGQGAAAHGRRARSGDRQAAAEELIVACDEQTRRG